MKTPIVIKTLEMTAPLYNIEGAICHSDRGSQYTSAEYRSALAKRHVIQSMNSQAEYAMIMQNVEVSGRAKRKKSWSAMKSKKMSCVRIKDIVTSYYLSYWNGRRICSSIGGVPPMIKRDAYYEKTADTVA